MSTAKRFRHVFRGVALLLTVALLSALLVIGAAAAPTSASALAFIDDTRDELNGSVQTGRIIQASSNSNSVNWGSEPMSFTFYLNDYDNVTLSVNIDDTSVVEVDNAMYRSALDGTGDFYGLNGNILVLRPLSVGNTRVTVTATRGEGGDGNVATCSFLAVVNRYEDTGEYEWGELKAEGGGCVTGYTFHPYVEGRLYMSTDIGGVWRFDFEYDDHGKAIGGAWADISRGFTGNQGWNARGIGVDPTPGREDWVYIANGSGLLRSEDRGETWYTVAASHGVSGMTAGGLLRGLGGDNLVSIPNLKPGAPKGSTDPNDYDDPTMYMMGTTTYRISTDSGVTWSNIQPAGLPPTSAAAVGIFYDKDNPKFRVMNFANASATNNGAYYSSDGGANWAPLPGQPGVYNGTRYYFPCKSVFTPPDANGYRYIFVTYSSTHNSGAQVNDGQRGDGCVFRWKIDANGVLQINADGDTNGVNVTPQMIYGTPVLANPTVGTMNRMAGVPISGLDCGPDGAIIIGTHNTDPYSLNTKATNRGMESVYRSLDNGETWFPVLAGFEMFGDLAYGEKSGYASSAVNGELNTNKWSAEVQEANPGTSTATKAWWEPWTFLHWNFGPKINPFNPDNMFIHSGMGSYVTYNLTSLDAIAATKAIPNARTARGLTVAAAREGLFSTVVASGTDETTRMLGMTIGSERPTSDYNDFRMYHVNNSPGGKLTRADMVKWETAPGLYEFVWKSGMQSPASGRNMLMALVCDYTPWRFKSLDDNPWGPGNFGQWIDPVYNYMYDGSYSGGQGTDWRVYTNDIDPKYLPPKPADDISNGGTKDYEIFAATSRGIHSDSLDYPDANPDIVVSNVRLDWHFLARGGATISFDGGQIFHNLPNNFTPAADSWNPHPAFALLGREASGIPSVNVSRINTLSTSSSTAGSQAGWVTINADATVVFWGVGGSAQAQHVMRTAASDPTHLGKVWTQPTFYSAATGSATMAATNQVRIYADRVDPDVFYAFSNTAVGGTNFLVSVDKGLTFRPVALTGPTLNNVATIGDYPGMTRVVKGEVGIPYTLWVDGSGLWKIVYDKGSNTATATQVLGNSGLTLGNRSGIGLNAGGDPNGALYAVGTRTASTSLDSGTGIYRSLDGGVSWTKISPTTTNGGSYTTSQAGTVNDPYRNDNWMFPDIRSVTGDPRVFGRVYVSNGNADGGIRYGEMITRLIERGDVRYTAESGKPLIEEVPGAIDISVTDGDIGSEAVAYLKVGGALLYETALIDGSATMSIDKMPAAGTYEVVLYIDGVLVGPSVSVTVAPKATELVINAPVSVTVKKGKTVQLDVTSNAALLVYASGNPAIATVSQTGLVTGVKTGMTVVTVYAADNSQKFAYVVINVIA